MYYFKCAQFVPNKGDAWTYYECDDNKTVLRQMTHIPGSGELTWGKQGDEWYIGIDKREFYVIPEAAVYGG